ncbi:MAG: vWA domain-containing protein [Anaerolineae bacterium]
MEEWEGEGSAFIGRIRRRRGWFLFLLLAGVGAVWAGQSWLFVEAQCPRLQSTVLYATAGSLTFLVLLWAALTRNDAPVAIIGSILFLFVGILSIATVAGGFLSTVPYLQAVFCPVRICEQSDFVRSLLDSGKLSAAEEAARDCLAMQPSTQVEKDCQQRCASELVRILYEKSDPSSLPSWERGRELVCREYSSCLDEALALAAQWEQEDLALTVQERQRRLAEACATPTPYVTPTPVIRVEVFRTRWGEREAFVDVRVLQGGQSLQNLTARDFRLFSAGGPLPFQFEARSSDDPVCVIAVVDNSGSVRPGLEQIREALRKLNEARKPQDELGMVLFARHDQIFVVQEPSSASLPADRVDATGSHTALWDAVLVGLETAQSCHYPNRYLILLTDGRDNDSRRSKGDSLTRAREIAEQAAKQGISVCAVGVASKDLEEEPLHLVATGCGYYLAENFDMVASLFHELFGYIRDFYRLRVEPGTVFPGSTLTLQVLSAEVTFAFSEAP